MALRKEMRSVTGASHYQRGFSFLEILGAIVILSMSVVVIMDQQTRAMDAVSRAQSVDQATSLAQSKLNEIEHLIATRGISALAEQEEGEFDQNQFPGVRWKYWRLKVPAPDFQAIASTLSGSEGADGDGASQQTQMPTGPLQMISQAWGQALTEVHVQVISGTENSPRVYELVTHLIAQDITQTLDGLTRSLSGLAGQGGDDSP